MQGSRNATKAIEFKSGTFSATTAIIRDTNAMHLADAMHALLGGRPDFFAGEPAILDFSQLQKLPERVDWPGLTSLLRRYRLQPVVVRHLPESLADSARKAGLAVLHGDESLKTVAPPPAPQTKAAPVEPPAAAPAPSIPSTPKGSMLLDRPLRSGQQVYARGADLVIIGGVSNGAEVIADGSIHCYGPLRGRAIAGAVGDNSARIFTTALGAELVSIAGVFRTFEKGLPEAVAGKPAQIRLVNEANTQQIRLDPLVLS
ncbi:MAG: septum site-determining protein MinC [Betaproteobacteria bacterium]|nr:septum site-determining protein MinC [Betaproteobacteria bacterium]